MAALRLCVDDLDRGICGMASAAPQVDLAARARTKASTMRAAQGLEHGVEGRGGQAVLELEFHAKTDARAAIADRIEAPLAGQVAERPVRPAACDLLRPDSRYCAS